MVNKLKENLDRGLEINWNRVGKRRSYLECLKI